jgi:steroid 5-alpha reductase family enzyme
VGLLGLVVLGWVVMTVAMAVLWLVQRAKEDAGVVDVGWSGGIGALAVLYGLTVPGNPARRLLVAVLAGVWSARLAIYVLLDRVIGRPEDGRYRALRQRWGPSAQRNFFIFFQVQALLDVAFALPLIVAMAKASPLFSTADLAGTGLWVVAVIGETMADVQLARFRADPRHRGCTCRTGLWRASRHPNYFFEWLHWWTYVLLGIGSGLWPLTLLGPLLMALFLFKVTGIPATEAQALASRGEDYREYQRTTSAFIPWFPKRGHGGGAEEPGAHR